MQSRGASYIFRNPPRPIVCYNSGNRRIPNPRANPAPAKPADR